MRKSFLPVMMLPLLLLCSLIFSCTPYDEFDVYVDEGNNVSTEEESELDDNVGDMPFEVHFIDVGQADASLVICEGVAMLIDGGNKADSALLYTYLEKYGVNNLDYVVATHVHEDHMGGIAGALNYANIGTVYCNTTEHESELFADFKTQVEKSGASVEVPEAGHSFNLGSATVDVISCEKTENENNASIVLRIVYGKTSFLFTGDIEKETEERIVRSGVDIKSTVLKVAHHGSENSTLYPFLVAASPEYAVISTGKNEYGHPSADTLKRLEIIEAECYRTDVYGDIICSSDGKNVMFSFEKA